MASNMPAGYSDDGEAVTHGKDTAVYQSFLTFKKKFRYLLNVFKDELPNEELKEKAEQAYNIVDEIVDDLNQPL